jgi:hypothetical protein
MHTDRNNMHPESLVVEYKDLLLVLNRKHSCYLLKENHLLIFGMLDSKLHRETGT